MARKRPRTLIIVVVLLVALGISSYALAGMYTNDDNGIASPQDINDYATISLFSRNGLNVVSLPSGGKVTTSQYDTLLQDTQLFVRIDFLGSVTAGETFYGVLHSGFLSVETAHAFNEGNPQVWFMVFDLGSCLMGEHDYAISFRGEFNPSIPMVGESVSFIIDNQHESQLEPAEITTEPADFQVVGTGSKTLTWTITYLADFTVSLKINNVVVKTESFSGSPNPQNFIYTFSTDYDGEHEIVLYINGLESSSLYGYSSGNNVPLPTPIDWNILLIGGFGIILIVVIVRAVRK